MIVHGLDLSYFTGKLEGYLRAKGLAYRLVEMDTASFRACGERTGVRQMPQLQRLDGRWMTDTPLILDALEAEFPESSLTPDDPTMAFLAGMIETFGDEHLWRPALYYRWAPADDARLMSRRIATGMMRDLPLPVPLRQQWVLQRQRRTYLSDEGITRRNAHVPVADYRLLLEALEPVFRNRDWLLGDAPTRADIGLFGPLFRHFGCDPTPAAIMRRDAPAVAAWVARLWALTPDARRSARALTRVPDDLKPLMNLVGERFLPEMEANTDALKVGAKWVVHEQDEATLRYRPNPYRAWRLDRLRHAHAALTTADRLRLQLLITPVAQVILATPTENGRSPQPPTHPDAPVRDRWWRGASMPADEPRKPTRDIP